MAWRPLRERDVPIVLEIERAAYPYPWSEGIFRDCLRAGYACWVMQVGRTIVAYGILSCGAGECHLLNLCVHPDWQGRRLGRRLLRWLLESARRRQADTVFLEVRGSNRAAIALYQSEGFCEIGTRRGYYPRAQGREDALVMARVL